MSADQRFIATGIFAACLSACGSDSSPPTATIEDTAALRGKQLYLDGGRLVGTGVSCVDCHGDVVGSAFALGKAANNPAAIDYAINAVPQMARSRGRYTAKDMQDLATYIGNPATPSPDLRLQTSGPAANSFTSERLDFGTQPVGSTSASSSVRLTNVGQLALRIINPPLLNGPDSAQFEVVSSDCKSDLVLQTQQSCQVTVNFRANGSPGLRTAAVFVAHDWIRGGVSVALIGSAVAQ